MDPQKEKEEKGEKEEDSMELKTRSCVLTGDENDQEQYVKRASARAFLRAVGWENKDFKKPLVLVCAPDSQGYSPCNAHFSSLAKEVVQEIERMGGRPVVFSTPTINDGMTMGTEGMRYSLPSRDLIADSCELMYNGYGADAMITIGGCDKTQPGVVMPLARCNIVGATVYGGSILPGHHKGDDINIGTVYESIGKYKSKVIDIEELNTIECKACPGSGSCGGMFTANTMALCFEALGISPPHSACHSAVDRENNVTIAKKQDCRNVVQYVFKMLKEGKRARQFMTKSAFENCIAACMLVGGSTNAVLHLLALAKEADVDLKISDFNDIAAKKI